MSTNSSNSSNNKPWFVTSRHEDGKLLIIRGRADVPPGIVTSDYPTLVKIFWPYEPANDSGMSDEKTNDAQLEMEAVLDVLDLPGVGCYMLNITGNGRTTWYWYVCNLNVWVEKLNTLLTGKRHCPIEMESAHDPSWSYYRKFRS